MGDRGIDRLYGDNGNNRLDTGADSDPNEIAYGGNGFDSFEYHSATTPTGCISSRCGSASLLHF